MTGVRVIAIGWLSAVLVIPGWQWVGAVYGLDGVEGAIASIATICGSLIIIVGFGRKVWRGFRKAERAISTILKLDEKLDEHQAESKAAWEAARERLATGDQRMARIEGQLGALALGERAAVRGALDAVASGRTRTGWRE